MVHLSGICGDINQATNVGVGHIGVLSGFVLKSFHRIILGTFRFIILISSITTASFAKKLQLIIVCVLNGTFGLGGLFG